MEQKISCAVRVSLFWVSILMLLGSLITTPLSLYWFAKGEPPFVIILSEAALWYSAYTTLALAAVEKKREEDSNG